MIIAIFSYRHDADLVPALLENIAPLTHAWVSWDDRQADRTISTEPDRRNRLLAAARDMGADWILAVDPDERFETGLREKMAIMTAPGVQKLWSFSLREMFGPQTYRIDGIWGNKTQIRLFPIHVATGASEAVLHGRWYADDAGLQTGRSGYDLYHLRMATPERRRHRYQTYVTADPGRKYQSIGYDYLVDERGMVLVNIPAGRGFLPPHPEDGALWAAPLAAGLAITPDPVGSRLIYAQAAVRAGGMQAAALALQDVIAMDPDDADLLTAAAHLYLEAGDHHQVDACMSALAKHTGAQSYAQSVQARSLAQRGDASGSAAAVLTAVRACKGNRYLAFLTKAIGQSLPDAPALAPGDKSANWRRWVTGPAQMRRGSLVPTATIAVVIIGFRAPKALRAAVQSVIDQDMPAEIVVVNSGGGKVKKRLAGLLDRIVLITVTERLFIGAARNIGIDVSGAPFVAFLAADCLATPGWNRSRVIRHLAGAQMVSTPVMPHAPANPYSQATNSVLHWRRRPGLPQTEVVHYGRSYARSIFQSFGYFAPGLRIMEDTEFHARIPRTIAPVWAPEVLTLHRYPTGAFGYLRDILSRSARRAATAPYDSLAGPPVDWRQVWSLSLIQHKATVAALQRQAGMTRPAPAWRRIMIRGLLAVSVPLNMAGLAIGYRRMAKVKTGVQALSLDISALPLAAQQIDRLQNWRDVYLLAKQYSASADPADTAKAVHILQKIATIAPAEPAPVLLLCDLLLRLGQPDRALEAAESALIIAPENTHFWSKASLLALQAGKLADAVFYGQAALARAPANLTTHLNLERVYRALDKPYLARRRAALRKALTEQARS